MHTAITGCGFLGYAYQDLRPDYFDRLEHGKLLGRLVRKIEDLGYAVTLTVQPAA